MIRGTVKWFDENKGFGFITAEGGKDVFVHHAALQGPGRPKLYDGQRASPHDADRKPVENPR